MSNLFAKVEQEAFRAGITPRTKQSRAWFRSKLASMGKVNRNTLMRDEQVKLVNKSLKDILDDRIVQVSPLS